MLNLWTTFCQTMRYPRLTIHLLLWGTDAVRRVSHQTSTQPDVGCDVRRGYLCVGSLVELFFFPWIRADLASIRENLASIHAKLSRFGHNRVVSASDWNGWNGPKWPKQAKISLESCWNSRNWLWMRPKHPKSVILQFYSEYLLLLLCFLFCFVNQGHSNVFFKNILIVKIYRKYK